MTASMTTSLAGGIAMKRGYCALALAHVRGSRRVPVNVQTTEVPQNKLNPGVSMPMHIPRALTQLLVL